MGEVKFREEEEERLEVGSWVLLSRWEELKLKLLRLSNRLYSNPIEPRELIKLGWINKLSNKEEELRQSHLLRIRLYLIWLLSHLDRRVGMELDRVDLNNSSNNRRDSIDLVFIDRILWD